MKHLTEMKPGETLHLRSGRDLELESVTPVTCGVMLIPDAHCNGDMHAALDYAAKIKHAQKDFLTSQGIHAIID